MPSSTFVAVASCLVALVHGYANPGSCSGACNVHDPALIQRQSDGKYFRFSTGNKISYASSSSIQGPWTVLGSVLPSGSSINLDGKNDLWVSNTSVDMLTSCLFISLGRDSSSDHPYILCL
jgi:arabinan endo-1,5-alpha-L-arabinosidase